MDKIDAEQLKEMKAFFDSVDDNGDGYCTWEEGLKFMREKQGMKVEEGTEEYE